MFQQDSYSKYIYVADSALCAILAPAIDRFGEGRRSREREKEGDRKKGKGKKRRRGGWKYTSALKTVYKKVKVQARKRCVSEQKGKKCEERKKERKKRDGTRLCSCMPCFVASV